MIEKVYYWFWHDLLRLHDPISQILINSVRDHSFVWSLTGSLVLSTLWVLAVHLIAMR